jgi:hypothetical protein
MYIDIFYLSYPGWHSDSYCQIGVCLIFLCVDRSTNEIHKPRALFQKKYFTKRLYLLLTDIFYVNSFSINVADGQVGECMDSEGNGVPWGGGRGGGLAHPVGNKISS